MKPKKKIPTLYASNLLVKEVYGLMKKIDAMGDNIQDWHEEYWCEHPSGDRAVLLAHIKKGNQDITKWCKKLDSIENKISKKYGGEALRELDFVFRWKDFGKLKYAEKRKIKLNNF